MTSSDSLTNPDAELPDELPDDFAPEARRDLARLHVDGGTLVGGALVGNIVVLDPVLGVLWDSLDGRATVGDLTDDIVDALGGDPQERRRHVAWFLRSLHHDGFLVGSAGDPPLVPQPTFPFIPADTCLGRQLALGRMTTVQVRTAELPIRAAVTLPEVAAAIAATFPTMEPDDEARETVYLRASIGRVARMQQVFDTDGDLLIATRNLDEALAAFHRSVAGLVAAAEGGAWVQGPALLSDAGVTLLHPSMAPTVFGPIRRDLEERGVHAVPAGVLRIEADGSLTAVGGPLGEDRRFEVHRILLPGAATEPLAVRRLLDLVRRWDQAGFDGALTLAKAAPIVDVDLVQSHASLVAEISATAT